MVINTKSFAIYGKLISKFYVKGDQRGQSIYLDFESRYAYVTTPRVAARLSFEHDGESVTGIYVDIPTFLALCEQYDELEYNSETGQFSHDGEVFKLSILTEESYDPIPFDPTGEPITLSSEISRKLLKATLFMGEEGGSLGGVHLGNHVIVSTDREKMLMADVNAAFGGINIPSYILNMVKDALEIAPVNLYRDKNDDVGTVYFSIGDSDMELKSPEVTDMKVPDYENERFIQAYDHETAFVLEKEALQEVFRFMDPFTKNVPNQRIRLTLDDGEELRVEVDEKDIQAKRILPVKSCDEQLQGSSFYICRTTMLLALSCIADDFIQIQYDGNFPAYCISGETHRDNRVIVVNMQ